MKVLVADHDLDVRRLSVFMLESSFQAEVIQAISVRDAREKIKQHADLHAIICGFGNREAGVADLKRKASELSPPPLFLESLIDEEPEALLKLQEKLRPLYESLKSDEIELPQYCKISMDLILKLGLLHCDLFIKVSDSKFVKSFRQGDRFDAFDFARFSAKNIDTLYIRPVDARRALTDLTRNLQRVSDAQELTGDEGVVLSSTSLEIIANFSHTFGFTEETTQLTEVSVKLALKSIQESPSVSELYSGLLLNPKNYLASHSVCLAYLSCGLASLLGWANEKTFYQLTLAAFLHDLPLKNDALARIPDVDELKARESDFTEEEQARFHTHPVEGAALIKTMSGLPPEVALIIAQHHERPDGTGFPGRLKSAQIHPLAAIFIVAEHLISFRTHISSDVHLSHFIDHLDQAYFEEPFKEIILAMTRSLAEG